MRPHETAISRAVTNWAEPRGSGVARLQHNGHVVLRRGARGRLHPALGYHPKIPVWLAGPAPAKAWGKTDNAAFLTPSLRDSKRQDPGGMIDENRSGQACH